MKLCLVGVNAKSLLSGVWVECEETLLKIDSIMGRELLGHHCEAIDEHNERVDQEQHLKGSIEM
jgi:hypothetical protein